MSTRFFYPISIISYESSIPQVVSQVEPIRIKWNQYFVLQSEYALFLSFCDSLPSDAEGISIKGGNDCEWYYSHDAQGEHLFCPKHCGGETLLAGRCGSGTVSRCDFNAATHGIKCCGYE